MKRCAQCHGKLGLGVRFRNISNGHWWVHLRFALLNVSVFTSCINPRPAPGIVGTRFLPEGAPLSSEAFETMIGSGHVTGAAFMSSTLGPRSRYTPARQ